MVRRISVLSTVVAAVALLGACLPLTGIESIPADGQSRTRGFYTSSMSEDGWLRVKVAAGPDEDLRVRAGVEVNSDPWHRPCVADGPGGTEIHEVCHRIPHTCGASSPERDAWRSDGGSAGWLTLIWLEAGDQFNLYFLGSSESVTFDVYVQKADGGVATGLVYSDGTKFESIGCPIFGVD